MDFSYPVTLIPDPDDGGYVVSFADLPEAITQGDTVEESLDEAQGALEAAIEYRVREGLELPEPSTPAPGQRTVAPPIHTALKAALYRALRESDVSKTELARRLDLDEKEARRILDPRHATRLPTMEKALRALGKHVEVRVW
ncbi:MAG: type II toxin-antitoxin system HicB family antitoxin [Deltaproteobacteria bacterium]|nr:type II toxin-antitoxin system HicB family antitoxin [Deltaproteobacteria bacterium]